MAGRTITSSRTATTENTPNRRSSAASFFGTAGALTRRSDSRRQLLRPPINANAVVNELVDSEVVSDDANQNTFHLTTEMMTNVQLQTDLNSTDSTTDDSPPQFQSVVNDATSIDDIR